MSPHNLLLSGTIYACNWREENAQYCLVSFHCRGLRRNYCLCPKVNLLCSYHVEFVLPRRNSMFIFGVRNGECKYATDGCLAKESCGFYFCDISSENSKEFCDLLSFFSCNMSYIRLISSFPSFCPFYVIEVLSWDSNCQQYSNYMDNCDLCREVGILRLLLCLIIYHHYSSSFFGFLLAR